VSDPSSDPPPELRAGLRWGIKTSFIDYVRRMPDGKGWLGEGAVPVGPYEVLFPPQEAGSRPTDDGTVERFWTFRGDVRFSGHAGMLFVQVTSPILTEIDGAAQLTVADPAGVDGPERLLLVTLRLASESGPDGYELWRGTDVRLTAAGTALFNDVYPAGEPLEPLTVLLPMPDGKG
jgi:hypothetical protein